MTAIVGTGSDGSGKLRCNLHEFETLDLNEWHNHCETTEGHSLVGETLCEDCKRSVDLGPEGVPYTKDLKIRCPSCFDNYVNAHQNVRSNVSLKQVPVNEQNNEVVKTQ